MRALLLCVLFAFGVLPASAQTAASVASPTRRATTEIGALQKVPYRIDIPANWNRGVVVYFHGYEIDPVRFTNDEPLPSMFAPLLNDGFAVIQSAYSQTGWAVEQGSADSERLRTYFVAKHGQPEQTFAVGLSMGGTLTVMAMESEPQVYDGGLSLCGVIEATDRMMRRDFALRAAFDYYFPGVLGKLVPVAVDFVPSEAIEARIASAMHANPEGTAAVRAIYRTGDSSSLPGVIVSLTYDIMEMQRRAHGNPFGNANLIYTGPIDAYALNDGVKRYRADPRAAAYLSRWYTPTGKLLKPLLALHDTGDTLVVASTPFEYALLAQRAGHADNFVQQYVNAEGHCNFTAEQISRAFDELVEWSRAGKRPRAGRLPK
ncbi:MAG: alpha/beta hydrolase [Dokdonella sp.]